MNNGFKMGGIFKVKCFDVNDILKWETTSKNLVVDEGIGHVLDAVFTLSAVTPHANFYIGLTDGTPTVAGGDTLVSHAGWVEVTDYSEVTRQEYVEARTGYTVDNSASKAVFSINGTATVGGSFICSAGTGTAGELLAASAFANGDKSVTSGDTIEVQYDFSASST